MESTQPLNFTELIQNELEEGQKRMDKIDKIDTLKKQAKLIHKTQKNKKGACQKVNDALLSVSKLLNLEVYMQAALDYFSYKENVSQVE